MYVWTYTTWMCIILDHFIKHGPFYNSQCHVISEFLQTASWLCGGLSAMEDIVQPLSDPVELRDVLQHFKTKRNKISKGKSLKET